MLIDPPERDVNPFLIRTGIRTMTELVLTLTIHDKDVTMVKPARVSTLFGQDVPFHLKSAQAPKLTGTRASNPHALQTAAHYRAILPAISVPGKGSGSQQLAHLPQHTMASSRER